MLKFLVSFVLAFVALIFATDAYAELFSSGSGDDRIEKLEKQIAVLEKSLYEKGLISPSRVTGTAKAQALFEVRLSKLEDQLQGVTGRLEEAEFTDDKITKNTERLKGEIGDDVGKIRELITEIEEKMGGLNEKVALVEKGSEENRTLIAKTSEEIQASEEKLAEIKSEAAKQAEELKLALKKQKQERPKTIASAKAPSSTSKKKLSEWDKRITLLRAGKPKIPSWIVSKNNIEAKKSSKIKTATNDNRRAARAIYDRAFNMMRGEKYKEAAGGFHKFIETYPGHELVANSYYWLGETFYVQDDFDGASNYFSLGYKTNKQGGKAPDNLLKMAMALGRSGKKESACLTLKKLELEFPSMPVAVKQRQEKERELFQCQ